MVRMTKFGPLLVVTALLIGACSAIPGQPPAALALEKPQQPFQSGIEIAKPTYTPLPTVTFTASPPPPVDTPVPVSTDATAPPAFAADAFVVIENLSYSAGYGYDSSTQYNSPPPYGGSKRIQVDIS